MPRKQKLTSLQQRALAALQRSFLLSGKQKQVWGDRISTFNDQDCERFLLLLKKESTFVLGSLEKVLNKTLTIGDQNKIQKFERLLTNIRRKTSEAEELQSKQKDSAQLSSIEKNLNQS